MFVGKTKMSVGKRKIEKDKCMQDKRSVCRNASVCKKGNCWRGKEKGEGLEDVKEEER